MRKTESQKIALCGMLGALSVVLLLLGSALQIGTYAAPMLAAFLLIPVLEEYGTRYALTLYVCVAILAVLFVPETELALFYVLVMGYYPVLRVKLNGVKSKLFYETAGRLFPKADITLFEPSLTALLDLGIKTESSLLCAAAEKNGIKIIPSKRAGAVYLCLAGITENDIPPALEALKKVL